MPLSPSTDPKVATLSTESIASPAPSSDLAQSCAACGALLAEDQRYCLECGERRFPMSSVLLAGPSVGGGAEPQSPPAAPPGYGSAAKADGPGRSGAVTVIAGVGVLLLAMGVGVLIGRSGYSTKASPTPTQVISVAQPAAGTTGAGAATTSTTPEAKSGASSGAGSKKGAAAGGESKSGSGANVSHPAPPTVVQNLAKKKGKNYEQESKNLPNVISTG